MSCGIKKEKKWFKPMFELDDHLPIKRPKKNEQKNHEKFESTYQTLEADLLARNRSVVNDYKYWLKVFAPVTIEDLAIHNKKIQEIDDWLKSVCDNNHGDMLLLTGPVGCGKTTTLQVVAAKYNIRVTEWITPLDIDIPSENGEYEYKQKQCTKFLEFILNAANYTSLLDNNSRKIVLIEDFPNTFLRTPSEFTDVLNQYKKRAKSPIVFICSESHTDNKNSAANLFTASLKDQYNIQHIAFNSIAPTNLKSALKRVASIINKNHTATYNTPTPDIIDCVVNSSAGDVRSAVLNLHFACLKGGSKANMDTSKILYKENKSTKKKKQTSSKFMSLGKDQTVSILHGVGRVLNPKVVDTDNLQRKFTHSPEDIIEQFITQPSSFVNFLQENYLPHFSCIDHVNKAASSLSDADFMIAEWREKMCQEHGLYTAVAGLMLANKAPVSAWNPVRGPKHIKIEYPSAKQLLLEENNLYKGKVLVADYQTYCNIINSKTNRDNHVHSTDQLSF